MTAQEVHSIMALDIGERRTGVALANSIARIASPLLTLSDPDALVEEVAQLVAKYEVTALVVGLPRGLQGQETAQTTYVQQIANELEKHVNLPVYFIDEAATSVKAETELKLRKKPYQKEDIDMLAATYILEDFMQEHPEMMHV